MRRFSRFSLASLLLMVVLVAAGMSAWRVVWLPVKDRLAARKTLVDARLLIQTEPVPASWFWGWFFTADQLARPVAVQTIPGSGEHGPDFGAIIFAGVNPPHRRSFGYGEPLTTLDVTSNEELLAAIGRLTDLRRLELTHQGDFPPLTAQRLSRLVHLEELDLTGTMIRDDELAVLLSKMTRLKTLQLMGTQITGRGLAALTPCRSLETLHLPITVENDELVLLPDLPRLAHLIAAPFPPDRSPAAHASVLRNLSRFPLELLCAASAFSGDSQVVTLPVISLGSGDAVYGGDSGDGMPAGLSAPFDLLGSSWTGSSSPYRGEPIAWSILAPPLSERLADRVVWGGFPHIKNFDLSGVTLRAADLDWLTKMQGLESLRLGEVAWSPADWRRLRELPHLRSVDLSRVSGPNDAISFASPQMVAGLAELTSLETVSLTLPTTNVHDLLPLANLPTKTLVVSLPLIPMSAANTVAAEVAQIQPKFDSIVLHVGPNHTTSTTLHARDLQGLDLTQVTDLTVQGGLTVDDARQIVATPELETLRVHAADEPISAEVVEILATHPSLHKLTLWSRTSIGGVASLAKMSSLKFAELNLPAITTEEVDMLLNSPAVRDFRIVANFDDAAVNALVNNGVTEIEYSQPGNVSLKWGRSGLQTRVAVTSPRLSSLVVQPGYFPSTVVDAMINLPGTDTLRDRAITAELRAAKDVTELGLPLFHLSDELTEAIACQPIARLNVSLAKDTPETPGRANEELARVFALAARLPGLTELRISSPDGVITTSHIATIAGLTKLQTLDLLHARTDGGGRAAIGELASLTDLFLTPAERTVPRPATHDGAFLLKLPNLERLMAPALRLNSEQAAELFERRPNITVTLSPLALDRAGRDAIQAHLPPPEPSYNW